MIKLDIEGFELFAPPRFGGDDLAASPADPDGDRPVSAPPGRQSTSISFSLTSTMRQHRADAIHRRERHRRPPVLALRPIARPEDLGDIFDVLWVPRSGSHFDPTPYLG